VSESCVSSPIFRTRSRSILAILSRLQGSFRVSMYSWSQPGEDWDPRLEALPEAGPKPGIGKPARPRGRNRHSCSAPRPNRLYWALVDA
jgi:hypothetical protein